MSLRRPGTHPTILSGNYTYEVEWEKMEEGMSFFVPSHAPLSIVPQLYWQARRFGYTLIMKHMYHDGLYGVMVWRAPAPPEDQSPAT